MKRNIPAISFFLISCLYFSSYASSIKFTDICELERWTKENPRSALEYTQTLLETSPKSVRMWYTGASKNDYKNDEDEGLSNPLFLIPDILALDNSDYTISASSVSKRESIKLLALFSIYNENTNNLETLSILMPNTFLQN